MPGTVDGVDNAEENKKVHLAGPSTAGQPFEDIDNDRVIINKDGLRLHCRYWKPRGEIRALVFHAHGYAEHCGRSAKLAERMRDLGIFSFSHDHVGHGESQGLRVYLRDFKALVRDVLQHVEMIRPNYPEVPIFIYGHSLGGSISILAVHERPGLFSGIMLSAPFVKTSPETATPVKVFLAKVVARTFPRARFAKLDPGLLSRDKDQIQEYENDRLVDTGGMRASTALQFLKMTKVLDGILPTIDLPIFLAHSESDRICDIRGSKLLIKVSNSKDKTLKTYKEAKHMLEHELPDFVEEYFAEVLQWIKLRIS